MHDPGASHDVDADVSMGKHRLSSTVFFLQSLSDLQYR
jgi:hypothetical protein